MVASVYKWMNRHSFTLLDRYYSSILSEEHGGPASKWLNFLPVSRSPWFKCTCLEKLALITFQGSLGLHTNNKIKKHKVCVCQAFTVLYCYIMALPSLYFVWPKTYAISDFFLPLFSHPYQSPEIIYLEKMNRRPWNKLT